jgi:glucose-6-phosphate 1-epimerase
MPSLSPDQLNQKFGIAGALTFEAGDGGFTRARIDTPLATGEMYLHGAHVTRFQPRGQQPVLFLSDKSLYQPQKPIRGGVPICFPWFGPRAGDASLPMHGFARLSEWEVTGARRVDDGRVAVEMTLRDTESTRKLWPCQFTARYTATFGAALELSLAVKNDGGEAFIFEEALHTYFQIGDIKQVRLTGLEGVDYLDKVGGGRPTQGPEPIQIVGETDRVYLNTPSTCVIHDALMNRDVGIEKQGSGTTVVWNPWDKVSTITDLGENDAAHFLCVETANAREQMLTLPAGAEHVVRAAIQIREMP